MTETPHRVAGSHVMVTGACGFIGSHLVRGLLANGARRVVALDSLKYGSSAVLAGLEGDVRLVRHRLGGDPAEALAGHLEGTDYLFHLAAEKHRAERGAPRELLASNIEGTHELLAAATRAGVRKVVYASTLYVYGRMTGPAMREDETPRPATLYGISKLAAEQLHAHARSEGGPEFAVLRYFFVYGPRQYQGLGYKSVIVRNFERLLRGERPTVFGDGRQALDYVYVDDAVAAALAALEAAPSGEVFNVGSSQATEVDALVDSMVRTSGRGLEKEYLPPDETAGSWRVADTDKARRVLGWSPRVGLEEGLERTFRWMAEVRAA
jgi:UDP-glucose 4-epimerase